MLTMAEETLRQLAAEHGKDVSTHANDAFPSREFDFMLSNPPYGKKRPVRRHRLGRPRPRRGAHHEDDPRQGRRGRRLPQRAGELRRRQRPHRARQVLRAARTPSDGEDIGPAGAAGPAERRRLPVRVGQRRGRADGPRGRRKGHAHGARPAGVPSADDPWATSFWTASIAACWRNTRRTTCCWRH